MGTSGIEVGHLDPLSCATLSRIPALTSQVPLCPLPDQFQVVPLQFSRDLDTFNPNTPEWREDVGLVVTRLLSKVPCGLSFDPILSHGVVCGLSEGRTRLGATGK